MNASIKPKQEFHPSGTGAHRLVNTQGCATEWAGYAQITLLDGWVGHTAFYATEEGVCTPLEFVQQNAVC